jgi:protein-tyrosine phosphatase
MKQVLFLCSANYYRSRFAEHVFNWLARRQGLAWQADSRGLAVGNWGNIGPISSYTVEALTQRGIPLNETDRHPQPLTLADLTGFDLVIAVKEAEHRPMMAEQFPLWMDRIEYWHIDDLDCATAEESLPLLESRLQSLVDQLAAEGDVSAACA